MVLDKKTKRDVTGIVALGAGLSVGTAVESKLAPPIAVFPKFAPIVATAGIVVGAGIVFRSLKQLPIGKPNVLKPIKRKRFL